MESIKELKPDIPLTNLDNISNEHGDFLEDEGFSRATNGVPRWTLTRYETVGKYENYCIQIGEDRITLDLGVGKKESERLVYEYGEIGFEGAWAEMVATFI